MCECDRVRAHARVVCVEYNVYILFLKFYVYIFCRARKARCAHPCWWDTPRSKNDRCYLLYASSIHMKPLGVLADPPPPHPPPPPTPHPSPRLSLCLTRYAGILRAKRLHSPTNPTWVPHMVSNSPHPPQSPAHTLKGGGGGGGGGLTYSYARGCRLVARVNDSLCRAVEEDGCCTVCGRVRNLERDTTDCDWARNGHLNGSLMSFKCGAEMLGSKST